MSNRSLSTRLRTCTDLLCRNSENISVTKAFLPDHYPLLNVVNVDLYGWYVLSMTRNGPGVGTSMPMIISKVYLIVLIFLPMKYNFIFLYTMRMKTPKVLQAKVLKDLFSVIFTLLKNQMFLQTKTSYSLTFLIMRLKKPFLVSNSLLEMLFPESLPQVFHNVLWKKLVFISMISNLQ